MIPPTVSDTKDRLSAETCGGIRCAGSAIRAIDTELEALLREVVVEDNSVADEIFCQIRPIDTFSARIGLACMLGLCEEDHPEIKPESQDSNP